MVMAQSLLRHLTRVRPGIAIDVLAPDWSRPLLERMPEVRDALAMPFGHGELQLARRYRIGAALRSRGYVRAIVLPNSLKSALVPFWARIPVRTGYRGEQRWGLLNDLRRLDPSRLPSTVERFVALGLERDEALPRPLPLPVLKTTPEGVSAALERLGLERPRGALLGICPGAEYGPAKRWPAQHFAELARRLRERGWEIWLFGSARDAQAAHEIRQAVGEGCVDLSARTTLAEAIDLLSLTRVVVTNDSGLMHVAAALGRPVVAVYGSSDPGFTPPLSQRATVVSLGLSCSPCFRRDCPLGHTRCLRDLGPERVLGPVLRHAGEG
jgi:heptosyltransferase-2